MAKESGLGWTTLSVDDSSGTARDIRNDVTNFQFATPRAVQDVTGVDKSAFERLLLLADFSITLNGVFNDAANLSHAVLKTVPTQAGTVTRTLAVGFSTGTATAEVVVTDYNISVGNDGAMTWTSNFSLANGTALAWT